MTAFPWSYVPCTLTDEQARALALETARAIGGIHDDAPLTKLTAPRTFPPTSCCTINEAGSIAAIAIARELTGWATLLDPNQKDAVRECARWKIQRLAAGLGALEELLLERDYVGMGEDVGQRQVVEIEVRF